MALNLRNVRRVILNRRAEGDLEVFVLFHNKTERNLKMYWINKNGSLNYYGTLTPGEKQNVNTFRSHPWIFRDAETGQRMLVQNQMCYFPKPISVGHPNLPGHIIKLRQQISIQIPVNSLAKICLWFIANQMRKNDRIKNVEYIKELQIPETLKTDLFDIRTIIQDHLASLNSVRYRIQSLNSVLAIESHD